MLDMPTHLAFVLAVSYPIDSKEAISSYGMCLMHRHHADIFNGNHMENIRKRGLTVKRVGRSFDAPTSKFCQLLLGEASLKALKTAAVANSFITLYLFRPIFLEQYVG